MRELSRRGGRDRQKKKERCLKVVRDKEINNYE